MKRCLKKGPKAHSRLRALLTPSGEEDGEVTTTDFAVTVQVQIRIVCTPGGEEDGEVTTTDFAVTVEVTGAVAATGVGITSSVSTLPFAGAISFGRDGAGGVDAACTGRITGSATFLGSTVTTVEGTRGTTVVAAKVCVEVLRRTVTVTVTNPCFDPAFAGAVTVDDLPSGAFAGFVTVLRTCCEGFVTRADAVTTNAGLTVSFGAVTTVEGTSGTTVVAAEVSVVVLRRTVAETVTNPSFGPAFAGTITVSNLTSWASAFITVLRT
jgi:hypothetical protein